MNGANFNGRTVLCHLGLSRYPNTLVALARWKWLSLQMDLLAEASISALFTPQAAYVVIALIVIEGLLSVDNALAIAALASHLDEKRRKVAMTIGYAEPMAFASSL